MDSPNLGPNTASFSRCFQGDSLGCSLSDAHKRGSICWNTEWKLEGSEAKEALAATQRTGMLEEAKPSTQPTLGPLLPERGAGKPSWGCPRALHTACPCCGGWACLVSIPEGEGPAPRCAQKPSPVRASPSAQGRQPSAKAASGASQEYELTQGKGPALRAAKLVLQKQSQEFGAPEGNEAAWTAWVSAWLC